MRDLFHTFRYAMRTSFHHRIAVAVFVGAVLLGGWHAKRWVEMERSVAPSTELNLMIDAAREGARPEDWSEAEYTRRRAQVESEVRAMMAPRHEGHARDALLALVLGVVSFLVIRYNMAQARAALQTVKPEE